MYCVLQDPFSLDPFFVRKKKVIKTTKHPFRKKKWKRRILGKNGNAANLHNNEKSSVHTCWRGFTFSLSYFFFPFPSRFIPLFAFFFVYFFFIGCLYTRVGHDHTWKKSYKKRETIKSKKIFFLFVFQLRFKFIPLFFKVLGFAYNFLGLLSVNGLIKDYFCKTTYF